MTTQPPTLSTPPAPPAPPHRTDPTHKQTVPSSSTQATRHRRNGCGLLTIGAVVVLVVILIIGGIVTYRFRSAADTIVHEDVRLQRTTTLDNNSVSMPDTTTNNTPMPNVPHSTAVTTIPDNIINPFTVLLIGVDKRENDLEGVRSDTIIVVHVNPTAEWASMLSIPRDSVVTIPHLGQQKINVAYTYGYANAEDIYGTGTAPEDGGGALVAETVEQFLDIPIDYIAQIDFQGFVRVVDLLGGVVVDVEKPIVDAEYPTETFGYERIFIPSGLQVFDGTTALRFARSRHGGADFDRSRRQQQILRALLQEVQHRGLLNQMELLPQLIDQVEQSIITTMPIDNLGVLQGLVTLARHITPDNIVQLSINPNDVGIVSEVGSDIYWNEQDVALVVAQLLQGNNGQQEEARIQVQNGAGTPGLASHVTEQLQEKGLTMAQATDAPTLYEHTMIIDYTGTHADTCAMLADVLFVDTPFVFDEPPPDAPPTPFAADVVVVLGSDYKE